MIDRTTFKRIALLGQTVADAATELEQLLSEVADAADSQLAACAAEFTHTSADRAPMHELTSKYKQTRDRLLYAAIAAGNLRHESERARTMKRECVGWNKFQQHDNYSLSKEIISVCEEAVRQMTLTGSL